MKKPELLAPAGNLEKLKIAVAYGADAVYLGGKAFGLRNLADNFSIEELKEGVAYAHNHGVKAYLTVNSYPNNREIAELEPFLNDVASIPVDALIVADPGVIELAREILPDRPIHLSTQANTTNWRSVRFWEKQGLARVNLAREMSMEEIRQVREKTHVELEVFVHGAMCISYSGRCLLSSVMSGRNANKGECAHPCRWSYSLVEETRPGEFFPVVEEEGRTFIFNSKDLCLLEHLPAVLSCGVDSLKIEGRMKGVNYLASVLRIYRNAIDRLIANPEQYTCRGEWLEELGKISHRGYTTGFFLGPPQDVHCQYDSRYLRSHEFVAIVDEVSDDGSVVIDVRNRLRVGDSVEVIGPDMACGCHTLTELYDLEGNLVQEGHPNWRLRLKFPFSVGKFHLIRKQKEVMNHDRNGKFAVPNNEKEKQ